MDDSALEVFSANALKDKQSREVQQILTISFEYLLAGISDAYAQEKNMSSLEDFNKFNKLGWDQLLVHPFFISLSNGHSEALFSLFGPFYSFGNGPASISIYDLVIKQSKFEEFEIDAAKSPIKVSVTDVSQNRNFESIKDNIRNNRKISLNDREIAFKNIGIVKDDDATKPLYAAIDNGIDIIRRQSKKTFFSASLEQVLFHASYFPAYWKGYRENTIEELTYEQVRDSKKPFYEDTSISKKVIELCY